MRVSSPVGRRPRGGGVLSVAAAGVAIACAGVPSLAAAFAAGNGPAGGRHALPDYVPLWTLPPEAGGTDSADLGPAPAGAPIAARVYLTGRDPHGLAAYAAAVADPHGALFHHYLTPAEVRRRFDPARGQVAAVRSWLAATGLDVTAANPHYLSVRGSAAEAARAFGAVWHGYRVGALTEQAPPPGARLSVPARVAGAVLTVAPTEIGLPGSGGEPAAGGTPAAPGRAETAPASPGRAGTSTPASRAAGTASAGSVAASTLPCSEYYGQRRATNLPPAYGRTAPYAGCGYTSQQLRSAYGVPAALTGKGARVAVVGPGRNATTSGDVARFASDHGVPLRPGQFTEIIPPGLDASCGGREFPFSEDYMAIEAVHGMAPDADIVYLGAKCDDDDQALSMLDELGTVTDRHLAGIVSGRTIRHYDPDPSPGLIAAYEQMFQRGAAEGIGFYNGTADHGDGSNCQISGECHPHPSKPAISYPAGDPWVTAVGGTSLAIGARRQYLWETGWGDHLTGLTPDGKSWAQPPGAFAFGGGGGTSDVLGQPSYQRETVPAALSQAHGSGVPMRVVPDVAADAGGGTGVRAGLTVPPGQAVPPGYREITVGGTSVATPEFAGMQADAQQAAGEPIGFANPVIYARYGTSAYHDVTDHPLGPGVPLFAAGPVANQIPGLPIEPYLDTFGLDQSLAATPGYDDVTGVGTLTTSYFDSFRPAQHRERPGRVPHSVAEQAVGRKR
ncbi:S53 family peptidase [Actinoallomurus rhizosphaericola]|uniref:S53 family peptidase n=1 Tax=Actinoallomurus rhizosphaericola TaxID=2952536 RepID=UPI00209400C9|nr:protease pro-enzyme activation domain-containing protein [Actinoallomurus rhizosphaericola]MCO5995754.1 protease pro-enzyme activation domain-containing protein [Actinoallomurus rhizosphaericola]